MQSKDAFSAYHPVVNFLYFALVLLFSMFLLHPLCLAVSLTGAVWYAVILRGKRAVWRSLRYILPVFVLAVGLNPLFNHTGDTVLCYLFSDNPLTWESVAYGFAAGTMLVSVLLWFQCYNAVMTSDKFIYLFGRRIPALSLVLSMALRFVPRFQVQLAAVTEAQKSIGRDISQGKGWQKVRNAVAVLSILVTWALENAMDTADSMKSRGYGLPGRTAFSRIPDGQPGQSGFAMAGVLRVLCPAGRLGGRDEICVFSRAARRSVDAVSRQLFPGLSGAVSDPGSHPW